MAIKKYLKPKPISVIIQKLNIKRKYKDIILMNKKTMALEVNLKVKPTESSQEYTIKVLYSSLNDKPKVYVLCPEIKKRNEDSKIPHNYGLKLVEGKECIQLCLFYKRDWDNTMNISDTIIPWACEWLYFYELWYISGVWQGGGIH